MNSSSANKEQVLVTGGSGFVGMHCILKLLKSGYAVKTTVRAKEKEVKLRKELSAFDVHEDSPLTVVQADLTADAGWSEAAADCAYLLHVASPFPPNVVKDASSLIIPAREGTLRVLRAAHGAGVKRVVITSSVAAVAYGYPKTDKVYDEKSWTNLAAPHLPAYPRSKTMAEQAAWEFMRNNPGEMELSVVNPVGIFGPVLGSDLSSSIEIVKRMMQGRLKWLPEVYFGVVDVRDVADLQLMVMQSAKAAGERFIATAGDSISLQQVAVILKSVLGERAAKVSDRSAPGWLIKTASVFSPQLRELLPELGNQRHLTNEKARRLLGWSPRSNEEALVATAESLLRLKII